MDLICLIDDRQLAKVPMEGPLIVVANHINFLEVPILYTHLLPRPLTGYAKAENWDNPPLRFLFELWGAIPVRRGEADIAAIRRGCEALQEGKILAIAPEGTRSGHGRLQTGHPGVVVIALRTGAPILPLVYYGGEKYQQNLLRLKRTDFHIKVGQSFHLDPGDRRVDHNLRRQIIDEIMYQLAALLPEAYRGKYGDLSLATEEFLRFPPNTSSNLEDLKGSQQEG
jgi:1-acyl-sn-glycerol-3-phosphate acyltransferase